MKIFLLTIFLLSTTSCKYKTTYSELIGLKAASERVEKIHLDELTTQNHEILRNYFSAIKSIAYEFKKNSKMQKYTHKYFSKYLTDSLCETSLVSQDVYKELMRKCTVNGFYICSEEVRHYVTILVEVKTHMSDVEMDELQANPVCDEKLKSLGVINE